MTEMTNQMCLPFKNYTHFLYKNIICIYFSCNKSRLKLINELEFYNIPTFPNTPEDIKWFSIRYDALLFMTIFFMNSRIHSLLSTSVIASLKILQPH